MVPSLGSFKLHTDNSHLHQYGIPRMLSYEVLNLRMLMKWDFKMDTLINREIDR